MLVLMAARWMPDETDTANDLLTWLVVSRLRSRRAPAPYEIGFVAFELCRSALDLHVPALQRGVLAVAARLPVQRRFVVTQRRVIMRLGCFQVPLGHVRRAYSATQARPDRKPAR